MKIGCCHPDSSCEGKVEGLIGWIRRNLLAPVPRPAFSQPPVMHFYSGPPVHFVSGVDTPSQKTTCPPGRGAARLTVCR